MMTNGLKNTTFPLSCSSKIAPHKVHRSFHSSSSFRAKNVSLGCRHLLCFFDFFIFLLLLPLLLYKSFLTLGHVMYKYEPHTQRYKYSSFNHKFFRLRGFLFQNFTINFKGFFTIADSDFLNACNTFMKFK